jgi:hypothetical protein
MSRTVMMTPMMVVMPGMMVLRHRKPGHGKEYDRSQKEFLHIVRFIKDESCKKNARFRPARHSQS